MQIAKALGARVTGVCSTRHLDQVRRLGADRVIDYTREDFTRGSQPYDLILDLVGNHPMKALRASLVPGGTYVASTGAPGDDWLGPLRWLLGVKLAGLGSGRTMTPFMAQPRAEDLASLKDLIEAGRLTPLIEQILPLEDTPRALAHVARGHAQGKTVLRL